MDPDTHKQQELRPSPGAEVQAQAPHAAAATTTAADEAMNIGQVVSSFSEQIGRSVSEESKLLALQIVAGEGWAHLYFLNSFMLHDPTAWSPFINSYRQVVEKSYEETFDEDLSFDCYSAIYHETRLLYSVRLNSPGGNERARELVKLCADVNLADANGKTPLILAVRNDNLELVELLTDAQADPDRTQKSTINTYSSVFSDDDGYTALLHVCRNRQKHARNPCQIASILLDSGANPNIGTERDSCLRSAVAIKNWELFSLLVTKGATNCSGLGQEITQKTSLQLASGTGNMDVIHKLVTLREPQDGILIPLDECTSCFHSACSAGHLDAAVFFESLDADVDKISSHDCHNYGTALYFASNDGHKDVVQFLIGQNADIDLAYSREFGGNTEFHLLVHKLSGDTGTATPLMVAAMNGHIEVVKLLVAANADVNRFNYDGKTAVELAREGQHFEVVELLVSHGAQRQRTWQGPIYKRR